MWDWKSRSQNKKRKDDVTEGKTSKKVAERFHCLECLELALRGELPHRFSSLCRRDDYSIKRHKERRHQTAKLEKCTIVPSTAPEVGILRKKFQDQPVVFKSKEESSSCFNI